MAKAPKPMHNWAACDPLMRKGGVHQEAKLSQRPRLDWRQALDEFEDWQDEVSEPDSTDNHEGPQSPSFFMVTAHFIVTAHRQPTAPKP
ncbi:MULTISPECIES: hypothetical protein [Marinobacter]|uniref:hypothetical protein n=1 Tax=Marinobacter TaxID=2742 RepID=UPI001D07DC0F|nr:MULTISPECIES: hypothetical protein [Marinobacter]MCK7568189.1 hypothetical protein [Marinobacter xestospongiae]UDL06149.1 hypothetical protein J2887_05150 [Marinobacter sp. CA1]